MTFTLDRVK